MTGEKRVDNEETVAEITASSIECEVENLRALADRLEAFGAGDNTAWTANDALAGHQLLVRAQAHVAVTRSLRDAATRRGNALPLHQPR